MAIGDKLEIKEEYHMDREIYFILEGDVSSGLFAPRDKETTHVKYIVKFIALKRD
jgi:cupin superfamily acireductone dioxygenase involved in methionine salvage